MMDAAAEAFGLADSRPIRVATVISEQASQSTPPPYPSTPPPSTPPPSTPPPRAAPHAAALDAADVPPHDASRIARGPAPAVAPSQQSWPPQQRGWLTPVLIAAVALAMGAALASVVFLATRDNGGTTTVVGAGRAGNGDDDGSEHDRRDRRPRTASRPTRSRSSW